MNKTAVITGGGTGIGRAISLKLAEDGFNIAVNCLESLLPQAQAVAEECRARGVEAECFVADVSKFDACAEMVKAVQERFGSVDVLVNNAGHHPRRPDRPHERGPVRQRRERQPEGRFQYDPARHAGDDEAAFGPHRQHGVGVGALRQRGALNYSASKAAIVGMTKTAARELGGRGITVNAVAPALSRPT